jgi:hypothetical protein
MSLTTKPKDAANVAKRSICTVWAEGGVTSWSADLRHGRSVGVPNRQSLRKSRYKAGYKLN